MLVHRIVVIQRELHHRDDLAEIRDQLCQQSRPRSCAEIELGIAVRRQYVEEQPVGFLVAPERLADEAERTGQQLQRIGVKFQPVLVGEPEQPQS